MSNGKVEKNINNKNVEGKKTMAKNTVKKNINKNVEGKKTMSKKIIKVDPILTVEGNLDLTNNYDYFLQNVHFYNGNIKTGDMLTFNKLAGNSVINGCLGTCGKNCSGCWNTENWKKSACYCAKSYVQYSDTVINSHIVNTMAMRNNCWETTKILNEQLKRKRTIKPVRQHSAGEIETAEELKAWMWLANQNPNRPFYVYTKSYEILDEVLSQLPLNEIPKNYFINVSVWHNLGIECFNRWSHIPTIRAYAYDDETFDYKAAGLEVNGVCPAYRKNEKGKVKLSHELTCDKCGLCFQGNAKVLTCLSH